MRLDIPFLEKDDQFVLYTDIDVMFLQSPSLDHLSPPILAAGPEFERNTEKMKYFNAGVLLMNIPAMQGICAQILNDINNGIRNRTNLYDQGYLNDYCYSSLTKLPLQLNWKPYWGYSDKAEIVHFHGMKPSGDMQSSGFAMSEGGYINCFSDNLTDVSGYVYYLLKFYEFLGQTDSNWIRKNLEDIFRIRYGKNRRLRALLENLLRG